MQTHELLACIFNAAGRSGLHCTVCHAWHEIIKLPAMLPTALIATYGFDAAVVLALKCERNQSFIQALLEQLSALKCRK